MEPSGGMPDELEKDSEGRRSWPDWCNFSEFIRKVKKKSQNPSGPVAVKAAEFRKRQHLKASLQCYH